MVYRGKMKHEDYLKHELWVIKRNGKTEILPIEQLTKKDKKLGRYRTHEILECTRTMKRWDYDILSNIEKGKRFEIVDNGDYLNGYLHIKTGNCHACLSPKLLINLRFIKQKKNYTDADILEAKILDWKRGFKVGREGIKEGLIAINKLIGERIEHFKKKLER